MGERQQRLWFPIVLAIVAILFTVTVLVIWNVIFTRYYLLSINEIQSPDLGVNHWLQLAMGCLFLLVVIAIVIMGLVAQVRQLLLLRLQKAFIDSVTHELKSPLASIKLGLETMEMREMEPDVQNRFIRMMQSDVDRLQGFIEHILEAGRLEHRERDVEYQATHVPDVLERALAPIKRRYSLEDDIFHIDINPFAHEHTIVTDPMVLEIVLSNLIENAIKYSKRETLKIEIQVQDKGDRLLLEVRDNGMGIPRKQLKRIFWRFYRIEEEARASIRGTGLGLYVVRSLVERVGGRVSASSDGEGLGSTFRVALPMNLNQGSKT